MLKILIIGGTGLISTAITHELVERGDSVTIYNRGQTTVDVPDSVHSVVGDRTDYAAFEAQMAEVGPFACVIDMVCYNPEEAESAVRAFRGRTGHFIFCSTVDVYTKPATHYPIREDEERQPSPSFAYAYDKAACENILFEAHRRGDFPLTIIRPAYTYGEGRGPLHPVGRSLPYLDRLRKGKPIVVHGDGSSLWASCHRDDVARAFVVAAGKPQTFGKSYHVTGEEWMTWNRYHQQVAEAIGVPVPPLVHIPTDLLSKVAPKRAYICKENFQFNNIFDNSAARVDLKFRYTIAFVEGMRRIVTWLDQHGQSENSDDDPFEDRLIAAWQRLGTQMAEELNDLDA